MQERKKRMLGPYEVRAKIGQGGMAYVFKAYHPALDRFVAVKVLSPKLMNEPEFAERFRREARAVAGLNHPNILPVHDFGVHDQYTYIVMRYVPGSITLGTLMREGAATEKLVGYISQVADALDYAHKQGIIHRDIKPSNILIDSKWALLGDFGLVKERANPSQLTGSLIGLGTPAYMSPEHARGLEVDHRTDIYALGVVLYEVLTGIIPHNATTPLAIIAKRSTEPVPPLSEVNPDIPKNLEDITMRALEQDPDRRYSNAALFARSIQKAYAHPEYQDEDDNVPVTIKLDLEGKAGSTDVGVPLTTNREFGTPKAGLDQRSTELPTLKSVPRSAQMISETQLALPGESYDKGLISFEQIQAHLDAIKNCHEYNRWAMDEDEFVAGANKDKYLAEEGKLLPIHASPYELDPDQKRVGLLKILRDSPQAVVLGEAGSGKTTSLERLMWEIASYQPDKPAIPILIRLLDFSGDLMDSIKDELRARGVLKISKDDVKQWLESKNIELTIMLDGMNEVPGAQREVFLPQIASLMKSYPYHRYILTSRVQDELWERLRQSFPSLTVSVVQPIKEEQIKGYLRAHLGPRQWWKVWRKMDNRLKGLARRPLMLWLVKEAATDEVGSLPRNRGELFENFVTRTLRRERAKGETTIPDHQKRQCLTHLAWDMQVERHLSIAFDKAARIVARETGLGEDKAAAALQEASSNGLLYGDTMLRFMHQSLQEHFVANKLMTDVESEMRTGPLRQFVGLLISDQLSNLAQDDWWSEPFIHTAGLMDKPDWLINRIAKKSPWLAYWCMDEGQTVTEKTRKMVEQSSTKQLFDPDARVRRRAVEALLRLNNARVLNYLPDLLADEDQTIGQMVYQAFLAQADVPVEPLLPLLQDKKAYTRRWTVDLLSQQDDLGIIPRLVPLLADEDEPVGQLVYETLSSRRPFPLKSLLALLANLNPDQSPITGGKRRAYRWVVKLLVQADHPQITALFISNLTDTNPYIRYEMVNILSQRRDEEAVPHLIPLLQDEEEKVGRMAYQALLLWPDLAQEPLLPMLSDSRETVRQWAVKLLGRNDDPVVIQHLIPLLKDKNEGVSETVYQALSTCQNLIPRQILPMLTTPRASVRLRAVKLIARCESLDAGLVSHLIPLLEDQDQNVGQVASEVLLTYQELPQEPFKRLLYRRRIEIRERVIKILMQTNPALKHKFDFIHIPAGLFTMGTNDSTEMLEKPEHQLYLADFWISRRVVTVGQYNDYLIAIGKRAQNQSRLNHPVADLSWTEAVAYCRWLTETTGVPITLPSEAQWEKAARGTDRRLYPWGNSWKWDQKACNTKDNRARDTVPVDHFSPQGDGPYGCQNMIGNVWEWTISELKSYPYKATDGREDQTIKDAGRTVRGGSFNSEPASVNCVTRIWHYPNTCKNDLGFRIVVRF